MEQLQLLPDKPVTPEFRKVDLSELPENLPGSEPDLAFIQSVKKFGILQPVGLVESDQGLLVAFGRRRLKAALKLNLISIPALIYPHGWTPIEVLTLIENQQRRDNLVAKLKAVESLRLQAQSAEICLAVGITKAELNKALKLIDDLIPELRQALVQGRMTALTAFKAIKLTTEQQQELALKGMIKGKDVEQLLKANTSTKAAELPESLFEEVPAQGWQQRASQLIQQLLATVPDCSEYHTQLQQLAAAIAIDNAQQQQSAVELITL